MTWVFFISTIQHDYRKDKIHDKYGILYDKVSVWNGPSRNVFRVDVQVKGNGSAKTFLNYDRKGKWKVMMFFTCKYGDLEMWCKRTSVLLQYKNKRVFGIFGKYSTSRRSHPSWRSRHMNRCSNRRKWSSRFPSRRHMPMSDGSSLQELQQTVILLRQQLWYQILSLFLYSL